MPSRDSFSTGLVAPPGAPGKPPGCPREASETLPGRFREAPRSTREAPGKHREASGTLSWPTCTSEPINFKKYKKNIMFLHVFCTQEHRRGNPSRQQVPEPSRPGRPSGGTREAPGGHRKAKLANMHVRTRQHAKVAKTIICFCRLLAPAGGKGGGGAPDK